MIENPTDEELSELFGLPDAKTEGDLSELFGAPTAAAPKKDGCVYCGEPLPPGQAGACEACEYIHSHNPTEVAADQTHEAVVSLGETTGIVRWPWKALDELCGPIPPGHVAIVAAMSGGGKTTFTCDAIERWRAKGHRICVLPLETRPREFRVALACRRVGSVDPGDIANGELALRAEAGDIPAKRALQLVEDELKAMEKDDSIYISPERGVNLLALEHALAHANYYNYDIVVVDHIDHVDDSNGRGRDVATTERVNRGAMELAQRYNKVLILTSQLNFSALRGSRNKLAKYAPPTVETLWVPGVKVQVATQIIGLFREIRRDATPDEMKAAREGEGDPTSVLDPHRMGIVAMKLRHRGRNDGKRVALAYKHGTVSDLPPSTQP